MTNPTGRYEAYCTHCKAGVVSRDSLVMVKGERLCARCCEARERAEARVRRFSGLILAACTFAGSGIGYAAAAIPGLVVGCVAGIVAAALIESVLRRY